MIEHQRTVFDSMAKAMLDAVGAFDAAYPHAPVAARTPRAVAEVCARLLRSYEKPAFGIRQVQSFCGLAQVIDVEDLRLPFCTLRHFSKKGVANAGKKVLLFAPLSGHYATLVRETIEQLLVDHDVYVTDWENASDVPRYIGGKPVDFALADYIDYATTFMARHPDAAVVCVCQATAPVLAAVALSAQAGRGEPPSLVLMAGPIDTSRNPTAVNEYARKYTLRQFSRMVIEAVPHGRPGAGRKVYPGYLQHAGFVSMNRQRHRDAHWKFFANLVRGDDASAAQHRKFYDEYNAVLDMAADYYLDTLDSFFIHQRLADGSFAVRNTRVDLGAIRQTRMLCIEAELDDICGRGQTMAALDLTTGLGAGQKTFYLLPDSGHYGVFSGSKFRSLCYPQIRQFLARAK